MLRLLFYALFRPNWPNPASNPNELNPASKPIESNPSETTTYKWRWFVLVMFMLFVLATATDRTPYRELETARSRGSQTGNSEGRLAGEADGVKAATIAAQAEAFEETITQLYSAGKYRELPAINVFVFYSFLILGVGLQWIVLYFLRRVGYLLDIDWIVLPDGMTEVDLANLSEVQISSTSVAPPSTGAKIFILVSLISILGCGSSEHSSWKQGYDAAYRVAYDAGWQDGADRGKKEGRELGTVAAQNAAATGRAWQFFSSIAIWALIIGSVVGVTAQYTVLLRCRCTGRVSELFMVALVPGFKRTVAYALLAKRRELMLWWKEEITKVAATKKLKERQMRSFQDIIQRKLKAISALEDFSQTRLIELARSELSRIVSASEEDAVGIGISENAAESPKSGNERPSWFKNGQERQ